MNKDNLPRTIEELSALDFESRMELWHRYFLEYKNQSKNIMVRILWYKIQCESMGLKLQQKYVSKLNKYAKNSELYIGKSKKVKYNIKAGLQIIKTYKGQTYSVVSKGEKGFEFNGKVYETLSGVASDITGQKVSGYDFFGFRNKNINKDMIE